MSLTKHFFKPLAIGFPIGVTFVDFVGYVARVDGKSMQPLLNPDQTKDFVFLSTWSPRHTKIQRGDVVSFISPKNPEHKIIKRVIGIQGDSIQPRKADAAVLVPEGHIWVEGDHTASSLDSNQFGPVSLGLVTAKATAIVWPPARWQKIKPELRYERLPINLLPLK